MEDSLRSMIATSYSISYRGQPYGTAIHDEAKGWSRIRGNDEPKLPYAFEAGCAFQDFLQGIEDEEWKFVKID